MSENPKKDGFVPLKEEKEDQVKKPEKKEESTGGFKNRMIQYVKKKVEEKIMQMIRKQKPIIKNKIKDKNLPVFVQNFADTLVEENWPILEEEVQYQLRMHTDKPFFEVTIPKVPWYLIVPYKIRTALTYSYMPNDKSFGQMIKDPLWILQLIAALCPIYGISSFYFILLFLVIDKRDEFQLIAFILSFKRFQLFVGLISGVVGFYLYFRCVDQNTHPKLSLTENCNQYGPNMLIHPRIDLIAFGINLLLVWITIVFLPFSEQKGTLRFKLAEEDEEKKAKKLQEEKETIEKKRDKIVKKIEKKVEKLLSEGKEAKFEDFIVEFKLDAFDKKHNLNKDEEQLKPKGCCDCSRGGGMKGLIIWDIISFSIAFLFFCSSYQLESKKKGFLFASGHIFFTKWIYAMLGFPFLLFSIPLVKNLLSRARPTAYDKYGNTVPLIALDYGEETKDEEDEEDDEDDLPEQDKPQNQEGAPTSAQAPIQQQSAPPQVKK